MAVPLLMAATTGWAANASMSFMSFKANPSEQKLLRIF